MKKRRIFLPLGVMGATIVPLATTISCGDENNAGDVGGQPTQTSETPKQPDARPSYPKDSEINPSAEYASAIGLTKIPKDTKQVLDKLFEEGKVWRSEPNATSMAFEPNYYNYLPSSSVSSNHEELSFKNESWVAKGGWTTYLLDTTLDYARSDFRIYGALEGMVNKSRVQSESSHLTVDDFFTHDVFHIITLSNGEGAEFPVVSPSDPKYDAAFDKNFMKEINPGTSINDVYMNEATWMGVVSTSNYSNVAIQSVMISVSPDGGLASIMATRKRTSLTGTNSDVNFQLSYNNKIRFNDANQKNSFYVDTLPQNPTEKYIWIPSSDFAFPMTKKQP